MAGVAVASLRKPDRLLAMNRTTDLLPIARSLLDDKMHTHCYDPTA